MQTGASTPTARAVPGDGYDFASVGRGRWPASSWSTAPCAARPSGRARPARRPAWVRDYLRAGVEVDDQGVARSRFGFHSHLQVVDALYDQRPPALYPLVDCPLLLCPAVDRALALLPSANVTWFEDTMHDIPLQRPAELAAELASFAKEVAGRV